MMSMIKNTIAKFNRDFPDDDACLEYLFNKFYGKHYECPRCHKRSFHRVKNYKRYACAWCGYHIHVLAGTIFHKSPTPLRTWFFAFFLMTTSKNGVAAKEIQRQTGVTYKTAWRMMRQIRKLMDSVEPTKLGGDGETVEVDETYIGGKHKGKRGRGAKGKSIVFGIVERKGEVKAEVVKNVKTKTLLPLIQKNVDKETQIVSDELQSYDKLETYGFKHDVVKHAIKEYVRGNIHTNTIDGFWSQLKRSIDETYHSVSHKHLPLYVDEFAWRYSHRSSEIPLFELLLSRVVS
jgi:transposase-like protein